MDDDGKVNILLVDDQPAKLLSYEAILKDLNENLVKASSATEALERLLKSDFAVILVDVCMPEQDGFELAEMIRAHHRFHHTAIIFVSAIQFTDMDFIKGYATGAVDYVSVPIVPEVLRAKVAIFADLYRKTIQLERVNEELEERVLERTAKLRETEEALREADHRKDVFLATLAHELRNPLAPMKSSLELLKLGQTSDQIRLHAADVMERQVGQMTRLIDDLMDLSRITRNCLELRRTPVDVARILDEAIEASRPVIDRSRHQLHLKLPPEPVVICADPARISQVLSNLLNNAAKYTPEGGTITLEARSDGEDLWLSIRDNGVGMLSEELHKVFEPFYQIKDRDSGAGLGIGLTLVRTIVELHGGDVSAFSEGSGLGTEVTVRLPLPIGGIQANVEAGSDKTGLDVRCKRRVLVVDDNHDAAQTLSLLLEHLGNDVAMASDGLEALEVAERFRPELVIMDLGMPGMNGYEAVKQMRATPWGKHLMFVAVTGWGQNEDRSRSASAGFDRHFVKPVSASAFHEIFEELETRAAAHSNAG